MTRYELIAALERDGKTIGFQARTDSVAKKVIEKYTLWYRCPGDNMAQVLAEEAYMEWKKGQPQ